MPFTTSLTDTQTAKMALESAVKIKGVIHKNLTKNICTIVKKTQSNPNVPAVLKTQLGINANTGARTKTPPVTPAKLVAYPQATGATPSLGAKWATKPTRNVLFMLSRSPQARPSLPIPAGRLSGRLPAGSLTIWVSRRASRLPIKWSPRIDQASLPSVPVTMYAA